MFPGFRRRETDETFFIAGNSPIRNLLKIRVMDLASPRNGYGICAVPASWPQSLRTNSSSAQELRGGSEQSTEIKGACARVVLAMKM